jgi:AcrR family transcriptional regulator
MAQKSKKDYIVKTALPLFLENGFKGTSIDMVVKQCRVSKPTVYNHFPDKSALMMAVLEYWIESNKPSIAPAKDESEVLSFAATIWLRDDAVRFYALVIGEGWRFPRGRELFWEQFDGQWRKALTYLLIHTPGLDQPPFEPMLDQLLLNRLKQL